jgi:TonB family protein
VSVDAPATNLSDRDDRLRRTLDPIDRLDRDQASRIKSDRERASWEDRRSSKEPMDLTFLASGDGTRAERRTPSPRDPSRGGAPRTMASVQGGVLGDRPRPPDDGPDPRADVGADRDGSRESAPGMGVHDGRVGRDHRAGAHVMRARPDVVVAAVSVPAARRGRPRDDVDSDQEVATAVRSLVHTSTAGGVIADGHGGSAGGGEAGAGGLAGAGSMGRPMGPGDSEWWDLNTNDPRFLPYFRRIHSKLDPLWAFPLEAALELRQGTVIFDVTIAPNGSATPAWPPRRPSGVPEFDRNCFEAIQRASPFDPVPPALGAGELHVRMPFDAKNYVVK